MWIELTDLADERSLVEGEDCARRGRVEIVSAAAGVVRAVAHGSSTYHVVLRTTDWSCTCGVGTEGQFCKHLVATALVASGQTGGEPTNRSGVGDGELVEITSWLGSLGEASLRGVLVEIGRRHPAAMKALAALLHSRSTGGFSMGEAAIDAPTVAQVTKSDDR
ncbi:SWIM zinc finger family protein [Nocardioides sp. T2.26MG-1]|uniref:SWIM zinc finger family protein n=1 Tax=Nocardioides sp. T2.26MG-1 TaxID=3041166 RepID=UPI002477A743|nr:SWIM zinc finger family protein [Nocardioides sp. T2.26MG-1]CAI9416139.1 hypothetical protein HIDPHFAB_02699 [Nocardioides sp. T2.26MG-1]